MKVQKVQNGQNASDFINSKKEIWLELGLKMNNSRLYQYQHVFSVPGEAHGCCYSLKQCGWELELLEQCDIGFPSMWAEGVRAFLILPNVKMGVIIE